MVLKEDRVRKGRWRADFDFPSPRPSQRRDRINPLPPRIMAMRWRPVGPIGYGTVRPQLSSMTAGLQLSR
jgi:hypothetical protein